MSGRHGRKYSRYCGENAEAIGEDSSSPEEPVDFENLFDRLALMVWALVTTIVLFWVATHPVVAGILQMSLVIFALAWRFQWRHAPHAI